MKVSAVLRWRCYHVMPSAGNIRAKPVLSRYTETGSLRHARHAPRYSMSAGLPREEEHPNSILVSCRAYLEVMLR